jgi:peptidoglycan/LPS O-acetylase OafA/YrhL
VAESARSIVKANGGSAERLRVLDGWRAASILLVLGCHLLPLGPRTLQLNDAAASMGMALFFVLSGFLITRFLLTEPHVLDFLIRRLCRILPIAWLGLVIGLGFTHASSTEWWRNMTFTANLPPAQLKPAVSHYWSLCIEVQFYLGVAAIYFLSGRRGLFLLPALALAVTAHRIAAGTPVDIVTWGRVDEILAGATLALLLHGPVAQKFEWLAARVSPWFLLVLLGAASHPAFEAMNYARPYLAAMLVGTTIVRQQYSGRGLLLSPPMTYVATISYALYIIHQLLLFTWLGTGEGKFEIYVKRLPLFVVLFGLAHLSTFYFEKPFIEFGKRASKRLGFAR